MFTLAELGWYIFLHGRYGKPTKTGTMKKISIALLLLGLLWFTASSVQAQTGIRFGVKAGYSLGLQYGILPKDNPYDVDSDSRHGFSGGILLYFPITDAFGVQQEFLYTNKGSTQNVSIDEPYFSTSSQYKLNYFEMPILFRYTFIKIGDVGIFGSTGFGLSMLLGGEYRTDGVIEIDEFDIPFEETGDTEGLDTFDYSFLYGLGVHFNLFNQQCFFNYRQTIGWNTLMMPTFGTEEPAPLRNQAYTFTLGVIF